MVRMQVWLVAAAALVALTLGLGFFSGSGNADETVRDGVFIHVTAGPEAPWRVSMACKMADIMMTDRDVLMYFDIKGVHSVLDNDEVAALIEKGVPVLVCPSCLAKAGLKPEQVQDGVKIAEKDAFFSFTQGRILTLDY